MAIIKNNYNNGMNTLCDMNSLWSPRDHSRDSSSVTVMPSSGTLENKDMPASIIGTGNIATVFIVRHTEKGVEE